MSDIVHAIRLVSSAREAIAEVTKYEDAIVGCSKTIEKYTSTLSGDRILKSANEWTAAVAKLGGATNELATSEQLLAGASKLTESEKARLNRTLTEAIEKYHVLGKDAPKAMIELADATKKVEPPKIDTFVSQVKAAVPTTASLTEEIGKLAAGWLAGAISLETITRVGEFAIGFLKDSVTEAMEAERINRQLTTALMDQGTAVPAVLQQYEDLAGHYQDTTVYSDELIKSTEQLLVQVGNVMPSQMDLALAATTDLASGLGVDLKAAAMLVGKAFEDNFTALKKAGIQIDETRARAEGMEYVLRQIEARFGGQARAEAQSYEGQIKQLGNQYKDLKESIGKVILSTGGLQTAMALAKHEITETQGYIQAMSIALGVLWKTQGGQTAFNLLFGESKSATLEYKAAQEQTNAVIGSYFAATQHGTTVTKDYAQQLADAKVHLANLSDETRTNLDAALKLGVSTDDLQKTFHLTAGEIDLYKQQHQAAEEATRKHAAELEKHKALLKDWSEILSKEANTSLQGLLKGVGEVTLALPAHLVAAMAVAGAHKDLGDEVTLAAIAMTHAGLSADDIFSRLKAGKQVTDDEKTSLKNLVDATASWDKALQSANDPLGIILKNTMAVKLGMDPLAVATKAVAEAHRQLAPNVAAAAEQMFQAGLSAEDVFKALQKAGQAADADKPKIEALANTHKQFESVLGDLTGAFRDLAQIGGDSFSGIAKVVGQAFGQISALDKGFQALTKAQTAWNAVGGHTKENFAAMAAATASVITSVIQLTLALGAMIEESRNSERALQSTLNVAHDFGVEVGAISEKTRLAIVSLTDSVFSESALFEHLTAEQRRHRAEALSLSAIIADLGGMSQLTGDQLAAVQARLGDLFDLIGKGGALGRDALEALGKTLDEMIQSGTDGVGLLSKAVVELIGREEQLGATTASVAKYRAEQMLHAEQGIAAAVGIASAAYQAQQDDIAKLDDLNQQLATTTDEGQRLTIQKAIRDTNLDLATQRGIYAATAVQTQAEAAAVAGAEIAAVDAKVKAGSTWIAAVLSQKAEIQGLAAELKATGFSGGAAFDLLTNEVAIASDKIAGPALTALEGYTQAVVGLNNSGHLTQEMYEGLESKIGSTAAAIEKEGFSHGDVMLAIQNDLQTAWELQQRYGYKVDDSTQALINEAVASGEVGEAHKSTTEQMLDLTKRMTEALEKMAGIVHNSVEKSITDVGKAAGPAFDEVRVQAEEAAKAVKDQFADLSFTVPVDYSYAGPPSGPTAPDGASVGGRVGAWGIEYLAGGGLARAIAPFMPRGTDTVPAMLTPGEGIVNRLGMSLLGVDGLRALNGGASPAPNVTIVDFSTLRDEVRELRSDMRRQQKDQRRAFKIAAKEAKAGI